MRMSIPKPAQIPGGWQAQVLYVDGFGNLGTNLAGAFLTSAAGAQVRIAGRVIDGLVKAFGDRPAGSLVALIDSSGYLSISLVNGDAARELNVRPGEKFEILAS
jgi:S-adenosylmethionine hydrolase